MEYQFAKLLFNDSQVESESLNRAWRDYDCTLLINLLLEENSNYRIIELLVDKGALINSETINQYCDENGILDSFFISEIINIDNNNNSVDNNYLINENNNFIYNNNLNNIVNENNNESVTLIDEYIRMMRKLVKVGGKMSQTTSFFYRLKELKSKNSNLFKLKDLEKVLLFFVKELNVIIDVDYLRDKVLNLYSLEEQQELRKFLLNELNITIYTDWTEIMEEGCYTLFN
ncbi:hypothetical protein ABK040_004228 [Willaertia magna]